MKEVETHFSYSKVPQLGSTFVLSIFQVKKELLGKVKYNHLVLWRPWSEVRVVAEGQNTGLADESWLLGEELLRPEIVEVPIL